MTRSTASLDEQSPVQGFLGFEDASYGRWLEAGDGIWTTTDGGSHWTRRAFP